MAHRALSEASTTRYLDMEEAEKRVLVLELRRDRVSVTAIARTLAIEPNIVAKWLHEAIRECIRLERLNAEEIVRLELEELDYLQASLANDIDTGNVGAILAAVKISESRRKLLGLDQPEAFSNKVEVRQYVGIDTEKDL